MPSRPALATRRPAFRLPAFRLLALSLPALLLGTLSAQSPTLLVDTNTAVDEDPSSSPERLTSLGNEVWFSAENPLTGREPYVTGGTPSTTRLLVDLEPGPSGSFPGTFTAFRGAVFFAATTGAHGRELYRSDGTAAGTALLADLVPGAGSASPNQMLVVGDMLYILAGGPEEASEVDVQFSTLPPHRGAFYQLWKSDGTAAGTVLVKDIHRGGAAWARSQTATRHDIVAVGTTVFFTASDENGAELWKSDGTAAGTMLVKDIHPGAAGSEPHELTAFQGRVWFAAHDAERDVELWSSDGTAAGTMRFIDLQPGERGSAPVALKAWGGRLYFSAQPDPNLADYLWVTDGTTAGTHPLAPNSSLLHAKVREYAEHRGKLLFRSANGINETDGTPEGTRLLEFVFHDGPSALTVMGGEVYFRAKVHWNNPGYLFRHVGAGVPPVILVHGGVDLRQDIAATRDSLVFAGRGGEPWASDGTGADPVLLADIAPRNPAVTLPILELPFPFALPLRHLGDRILIQGKQWWETDGTRAGTKPTAAPTDDPRPEFYRGFVYSTREDAAHGRELWKTDGTAAGTMLVKDILPGPAGSGATGLYRDEVGQRRYVVAGGLLYFAADDGVHGGELWRTDGTTAGTLLVKDIEPGSTGSYLWHADPFGDELLLVIRQPDHAHILYRTDGTPAGTQHVATFAPGAYPDGKMTHHAGRAILTVVDQVHGAEPWVTDGTPAGTMLLKDIVGGPDGSDPSSYHQIGDHIVFCAHDGPGGHGTELWRTDGTAAGTMLLKDIAPGPRGSTPTGRGMANPQREFARFGDLLYFVAHGPAGEELWRTDGTPGGTMMAVDIEPYGSSSPRDLQPVGSRYLWFTAWTHLHGREIWISDGSAAGTWRLTDIAPGSRSSLVGGIARLGNRFVFLADDTFVSHEPFVLLNPHAITDEIGTGCRRNAPPPRLSGDDPVQGRTVTLRVRSAPPSAAGVLVAGAPLRGGYLGGGCTLLVDLGGPTVTVPFVTDPTGAAQLAGIPVPIEPGLIGMTLAVQTGTADPATGPIGVALTNALEMTLGTR